MKVFLVQPRGFCAGVERAIDCVERALEIFGDPLYVRHEIVHNTHVVNALTARGVRFVESLAEVPDGAVVVFSAHGVSPEVTAEARRRDMLVIDGTCPLVAKVHLEVARHSREGRTVFLIGHPGHPEVVGTCGHYRGAGRIIVIATEDDAAGVAVAPGAALAYVTQTTLSCDETARTVAILRARFPGIVEPRVEDICYATQSRQTAVKQLAEASDVVVVVGSAHSSNSNRMREVAQSMGRPAYLVDGPTQLRRSWFDGCRAIGLTSGASVPEILVSEVLRTFGRWWPALEETALGEPEHMHFRLPRVLEASAAARARRTRPLAIRPTPC